MASQPKIITAAPENWCETATAAIGSVVNSYINTRGECTMMLTGGNTAKRLYQHWADAKPWDHRKITYYFGDERCVPPDHQESNFGMVMSTLFSGGIPSGCKVVRMQGEIDREEAVKNYEQTLPESVDILLLSVGPDGHVASLFPGSPALHEKNKNIVQVVGPKSPPKRITITPCVIKSAKTKFLFAQGKEKGCILSKALEQPHDFEKIPVRLVINSTWIMDAVAKSHLNHSTPA